MEVANIFKGSDLIDKVPKELWTDIHNIVQEVVTKTIPMKMRCRMQNGCLRRPYKIAEKRRATKSKGKVILNWMQSSREEPGEVRKPS